MRREGVMFFRGYSRKRARVLRKDAPSGLMVVGNSMGQRAWFDQTAGKPPPLEETPIRERNAEIR